MFGSNRYGRCFQDTEINDDSNKIANPLRIDNILKEQHSIKSIIDIITGFLNTAVICTKY